MQDEGNCVKILTVSLYISISRKCDENEKNNLFENKKEQEGN